MALGVIDCTTDSMVLQADFGQQAASKPKRRMVSTNRRMVVEFCGAAGWRKAESGGISAQ